MAFVGVEFVSNNAEETGIIALVHQSWFTHLKKQVWWPPYKTNAHIKKALFIGEEVKKDTWTLYDVKRIFFAYDDLNKANKKLKECEEFSDLQSTTGVEDETIHQKRKRKPNLKYINSSSDAEDDENQDSDSLQPPSKLYKSVQLRDEHLKTQSKQKYVAEKDYVSQEICSNSSESSARNSSITTQNSARNSPITAQSSARNLSTTHAAISFTTEKIRNSYSTLLNKSNGRSCMHSYEKKIFIEIKKLREQMKEIHGILKQSANSVPICDNVLVDLLPLKTHEELQDLENYLNSPENRKTTSLFLSTLGGDTLITKTNRILKRVLTNELAQEFNYAGQNNVKKSFQKLNLKTVVVCSVLMKSLANTENDVEKAIKVWLKHAPERAKENARRQNKSI